MHKHEIYDKPKLRMMVEGMLYRMRAGCPCATYRQHLDAGIPYIQNLTAGLQKIS